MEPERVPLLARSRRSMARRTLPWVLAVLAWVSPDPAAEMIPSRPAPETAAAQEDHALRDRLAEVGLTRQEIDARLAEFSDSDLRELDGRPELVQVAGGADLGAAIIIASIVIVGLFLLLLATTHVFSAKNR